MTYYKNLCLGDSKIILNFEFILKEKKFQEKGHYKVFPPAAAIVKEIQKYIYFKQIASHSR